MSPQVKSGLAKHHTIVYKSGMSNKVEIEQGSKTISDREEGSKKQKHDPPLTAREEWVDFGKTALIAVLLALLIRTFLFEPFNIPSGSMRPTLEIGDYLFVNKPAYGFSHYSFPLSIFPVEGRFWDGNHEPKRGDVIVFKLPSNPSIDYIKRIVALPGESIQMQGGELYINRKKVTRTPVGLKRIKQENGLTVTMEEYIETLPGGVMHYIYEEGNNRHLDNTKEYIVPEGHYFVMGDNRDNSQDSRVQHLVGFVPLENIVGRASIIFFSTNGYANIAEIWKWPWSIRYKRLFQKISPIQPE